MSKVHDEKITCPNCKYVGSFTIWDSINVDVNPEARDKVKDGILFKHVCKNCGEDFEVNYSTLYHDCINLFMIYLLCGQDEEKVEKIDNSISLVGNYFSKYTLRIVYSKKDLVEKIRILESKLDDIVIEAIKSSMVSELSKEKRKSFLDIFYIWKDNDRIFFQIFYKDKKETVGITYESYVNIKKQISIDYPRKFSKVNMYNVFDYIKTE